MDVEALTWEWKLSSLFVQSGLQVVFICCLLDKVIYHYSDLTDLIGYILSWQFDAYIVYGEDFLCSNDVQSL